MDRRVRIIDTYRLFIYDRAYAFACERVFEHGPAEPAFRFEPDKLDWKEYWLEVHMPGLRRWCFAAVASGA